MGYEKDEDAYYCDRCEEKIPPEDDAYEVKYGFICESCACRD
jgi:hypothetical protein